jgi:hypothetical protein
LIAQKRLGPLTQCEQVPVHNVVWCAQMCVIKLSILLLLLLLLLLQVR